MMNMLITFLVVVLACVVNAENDIYSSRALSDEIKNLPGQPKSSFRMFSGTTQLNDVEEKFTKQFVSNHINKTKQFVSNHINRIC